MINLNVDDIRRGQVLMVDFGENEGSVQSGKRPAIVIQNDIGNKFSPTTIVSPLTSKRKKNIPTHYDLFKLRYNFLKYDSTILCEQIHTISKGQIKKVLGTISEADIEDICDKIAISVGICINTRKDVPV